MRRKKYFDRKELSDGSYHSSYKKEEKIYSWSVIIYVQLISNVRARIWSTLRSSIGTLDGVLEWL